MSMVTVHGPNTMYTTQGGGQAIASSPVGMTATKSPTNGLIYSFAAIDQSRPAADYSWTFTGQGGNPAAQPGVAKGTVTFLAAGTPATIVCTVAAVTASVTNKQLTSNVATLTMASAAAFQVGETVTVTGVDATFNGTYVITAKTATTISYAKTNADVASTAATGTITVANPASGTYTINVSPTAGVPREGEEAQEPQATQSQAQEERTPEVDVGYDPGAHTVHEVLTYAQEHPDQVQDLLDAEEAGRGRSTLISQLEDLL
jgi:hypothetical protein